MPIRKRPVIEMNVYDETSEGTILYPAFGGRDRVYDLSKRDAAEDNTNSLLIRYVTSTELGQSGGSGLVTLAGQDYYEGVQFIPEPVAGAIAYPIINKNQRVNLNSFDAIGVGRTSWSDGEGGVFNLLADSGGVSMYNSYGWRAVDESEQGTVGPWNGLNVGRVGLQSRFAYPPNPIICLQIARNEPPPQYLRALNPSTDIGFGLSANSSFILTIPYNQPPALWVKHTVFTNGNWVLVRPDSSSSPIDMNDQSWKGGASSNSQYLWIGSFAGGIAVSKNAFKDITFFPLKWGEPSVDAPLGESIPVPAGKIAITHNAGLFSCSVLPVLMPAIGIVQGPLHRVPFDFMVGPAYGANSFIRPRQQFVRDAAGAVVGVVTAAVTLDGTTPIENSRIPADRTGFEWRAEIPAITFASQYTGSGLSTAAPSTAIGNFGTMVSPVLFDVIFGQPLVLSSATS